MADRLRSGRGRRTRAASRCGRGSSAAASWDTSWRWRWRSPGRGARCWESPSAPSPPGTGGAAVVGRKEMFYLTRHSTHFIYGYMASDIWTIQIARKDTHCHIGYSYRLTARVLYAPSHRQDNTYHGLCYTSRGALAGTRNSSMGPPHEGLIRRPIAP